MTKFEAGNEEEYKVEKIQNSAIYVKKSTIGRLPSFYYLIFWKDYPNEKNTWGPISVVYHRQKLLSTFHKDNSNKPVAISLFVNTLPLIAQPTVHLTA